MKTAITAYQKKLRLSNNLIEIYESVPYETKDQFIHDLLDALYKERIANITARNLKYANFPVKKTLESYDWSHVQLPDKLSIDALTRLRFLEEQENLILYGNFGAGKTHLSIAPVFGQLTRIKPFTSLRFTN